MLSPESIYPQIKDSLIHLYGLKDEGYDVLGNNENLVISSGDAVVRITPSHHRTPEELSSETELLDTLQRHGCSVVKIIRSGDGNLHERVSTSEGYIHVTVFSRMQGVNAQVSDVLERKQMIQEWGRTMGQIHHVTSEKAGSYKDDRLTWDQEIIIARAHELSPSKDTAVLAELKIIVEHLAGIPQGGASYGLVHTDMRPRNFSYHDNQIVHFDFDDICHHWFIYDVAVAAFHETENFDTVEERTDFIKAFLTDFLETYLREKTTPPDILNLMIIFMKLRCIYAYIDYYKRLKIKKVDSGKEKMSIRRGYILDFNTFIDTAELGKFLKHTYA